jgi:hypothetical protein
MLAEGNEMKGKRLFSRCHCSVDDNWNFEQHLSVVFVRSNEHYWTYQIYPWCHIRHQLSIYYSMKCCRMMFLMRDHRSSVTKIMLMTWHMCSIHLHSFEESPLSSLSIWIRCSSSNLPHDFLSILAIDVDERRVECVWLFRTFFYTRLAWKFLSWIATMHNYYRCLEASEHDSYRCFQICNEMMLYHRLNFVRSTHQNSNIV